MKAGDVYISKREEYTYIVKATYKDRMFGEDVCDVYSIGRNGKKELVSNVSQSVLKSVATLEPQNAKEYNNLCQEKSKSK